MKYYDSVDIRKFLERQTEEIEQIKAQGYEFHSKWMDILEFKKINKVPWYSSQIPKDEKECIGICMDDSPFYKTGGDNFYYAISRESYERMEIKPKLTNVYMPLRLHNYDDFVEITLNERKGIGWVQTIQIDYYKYESYTFFVED